MHIEADQRNQHQIKRLRTHEVPRGHHGFGDAETVGAHFHIRLDRGKPQAIVPDAREHGQVSRLARLPGVGDDET